MYLTVAVPRVPPEQIRGVRVAPGARLLTGFDVNRLASIETNDGRYRSGAYEQSRAGIVPDATTTPQRTLRTGSS